MADNKETVFGALIGVGLKGGVQLGRGGFTRKREQGSGDDR